MVPLSVLVNEIGKSWVMSIERRIVYPLPYRKEAQRPKTSASCIYVAVSFTLGVVKCGCLTTGLDDSVTAWIGDSLASFIATSVSGFSKVRAGVGRWDSSGRCRQRISSYDAGDFHFVMANSQWLIVVLFRILELRKVTGGKPREPCVTIRTETEVSAGKFFDDYSVGSFCGDSAAAGGIAVLFYLEYKLSSTHGVADIVDLQRTFETQSLVTLRKLEFPCDILSPMGHNNVILQPNGSLCILQNNFGGFTLYDTATGMTLLSRCGHGSSIGRRGHFGVVEALPSEENAFVMDVYHSSDLSHPIREFVCQFRTGPGFPGNYAGVMPSFPDSDAKTGEPQRILLCDVLSGVVLVHVTTTKTEYIP